MKRPISLLVVAFVAAGCRGPTYSDHEVNVGTVLDAPPLVEPLPVAMGVYYSPEFRNFKTVDTRKSFLKQEMDEVDRFHLALGEPSAALFDRVFSAMFERTVLVPARPPVTGVGPELDGIIEPRIKRAWVVGDRRIEYGFTLYSPSGEVRASWSVSGGVEPRGRADSDLRDAMRLAAVNFISDFREEPGVKRWLAGLGLQ